MISCAAQTFVYTQHCLRFQLCIWGFTEDLQVVKKSSLYKEKMRLAVGGTRNEIEIKENMKNYELLFSVQCYVTWQGNKLNDQLQKTAKIAQIDTTLRY